MRVHLTRPTLLLATLAVLTAALLLLLPALAQEPRATSRVAQIGGMEAGEVLVDGRVVFRIRNPAGGLAPGQRAAQVAERLNEALEAGLCPQDVTVATRAGLPVVMAGNRQIITATSQGARLNVTTPQALARQWAGNLQVALGAPAPLRSATPPPAGQTGGDQVAGTRQAVDWTGQADKVVPILSVGTPGVSLGAARVSGPERQVDRVRAVAQLDATFREVARIRVLVPVSSVNLTRLERVQGVSVNALIDMRIVEF